MSSHDQLSALLAEILAPGSEANVNERDAAQIALTYKGNVRMMGLVAAEQLEGYYRRVHLGAMATYLKAAGA